MFFLVRSLFNSELITKETNYELQKQNHDFFVDIRESVDHIVKVNYLFCVQQYRNNKKSRKSSLTITLLNNTWLTRVILCEVILHNRPILSLSSHVQALTKEQNPIHYSCEYIVTLSCWSLPLPVSAVEKNYVTEAQRNGTFIHY